MSIKENNYLFILIVVTFWLIIVFHGNAYAMTVNQWQYDGHDWYYTDPNTGRHLTGHHRINHIDYYFDQHGRQITPYIINYQYQLSSR